jgi:hypothetical protein
MKKYNVYTKVTGYYVNVVEAESEVDAMLIVEENEDLLGEPYDGDIDVWIAKEV